MRWCGDCRAADIGRAGNPTLSSRRGWRRISTDPARAMQTSSELRCGDPGEARRVEERVERGEVLGETLEHRSEVGTRE